MVFHSISQLGKALEKGDRLSVRDLYDIWEHGLRVALAGETGKPPGRQSGNDKRLRWYKDYISLLTALTGQALKKEEFLLVSDAYSESMICWRQNKSINPRDLLTLHSHYATAKTRLGFTRLARQSLEPLVSLKQINRKERAKILLQLGDIVREESHHLSTAAARKQTAGDAQKFSQGALKADSSLLEAHVSNAAMSLLLSEPGSSRRKRCHALGRAVLRLIDKTARRKRDHHRITLFRAVAYSVMGDLKKAAEEYRTLQTYPGMGTLDLAEARYRAQFLAEALGQPRDFFKAAFPPLQLIVFAGHLPDLPNGIKRFSAESISMVRKRLRETLDQLQARVGLVSAAAGADLLFIEAMRAQPGTKYHVILPWSQNEFYRTSVEPYDDASSSPGWKSLFDRAIQHAATVRELGQIYEPADDVGWEYTHEVTAGLALLTARTCRLDVQPVALWDGSGAGAAGGTASFVKFWKDLLGRPPIILDFPLNRPIEVKSQPVNRARSERASLRLEVKSMLFADIVGYSKLTEKVTPDLVETFFERVSNLIAVSRHAPCSVNTWGDSVYAVFDYAQDAGRFALQLTQMIRDHESDWLARGLFYEEFDAESGRQVRRPLSIRVGLHTGPVFAHYDPIKRYLGFTGSHVNRAARIEPIAAVGEVYSSEEFAAMAELGAQFKSRRADEGDGFICEYAGSMALAKDYPGRYRIYRVIPLRLLAMEDLARAVHQHYFEGQLSLDFGDDDALALVAWED